MENTMSVKEYIMKSLERKEKRPEIWQDLDDSDLEIIVNYLSLILDN